MGRSNLPNEGRASSSDASFLGSQKLPSVAAGDSPITGKLSFSVPTRIDGPLRGEVRSTALLVVGEKGSVEGILRANELLVLGIVRGEVHASRIEVGLAGRIFGKVVTRALVVNEGGVVEAECVVRE